MSETPREQPEWLECNPLITLAEHLLLKPNEKQILARYEVPFGKNYLVELRATSDWMAEEHQEEDIGVEELGTDARYVYLYKLPERTCVLSVELNALETAEPENIIFKTTEIEQAMLESRRQADVNMASFMRRIIYTSLNICSGKQSQLEQLIEINHDFYNFLNQGVTIVTCARYDPLPYDEFEIIYTSIQGDRSHAWPHELAQPTWRLRATQGNKAIVFEEHNGQIETSIEKREYLDELASYVGEEDIVRGEDGSIEAVLSCEVVMEAVREAERIMGLRQPTDDKLTYISWCLNQLLLEEK